MPLSHGWIKKRRCSSCGVCDPAVSAISAFKISLVDLRTWFAPEIGFARDWFTRGSTKWIEKSPPGAVHSPWGKCRRCQAYIANNYFDNIGNAAPQSNQFKSSYAQIILSHHMTVLYEAVDYENASNAGTWGEQKLEKRRNKTGQRPAWKKNKPTKLWVNIIKKWSQAMRLTQIWKIQKPEEAFGLKYNVTVGATA